MCTFSNKHIYYHIHNGLVTEWHTQIPLYIMVSTPLPLHNEVSSPQRGDFMAEPHRPSFYRPSFRAMPSVEIKPAPSKYRVNVDFWLMISAGTLYFIMCSIRLLLSSQFCLDPRERRAGVVNYFDFGTHSGAAFTDVNSFCYTLLGSFVVFYFPAFTRCFLLSWNRYFPIVRIAMLLLGQICALVLGVVPIYNMIIHSIWCWSALASSSFARDGFEWATGYGIGLCFGLFLTLLMGNACGRDTTSVQRMGGSTRNACGPESNRALVRSVFKDVGPIEACGEATVLSVFTILRLISGLSILLVTMVGSVQMVLTREELSCSIYAHPR